MAKVLMAHDPTVNSQGKLSFTRQMESLYKASGTVIAGLVWCTRGIYLKEKEKEMGLSLEKEVCLFIAVPGRMANTMVMGFCIMITTHNNILLNICTTCRL